MPEKPHPKTLDRKRSIELAHEVYSRQIELLQDLANYGPNLIPATLSSSEKSLGDVITIAVLLKQVVRMLAAFEVCLLNGYAPAALLPVRAAFEASISIDWILKSDQENKAKYYYVSNIRQQRMWLSRRIKMSGKGEQ